MAGAVLYLLIPVLKPLLPGIPRVTSVFTNKSSLIHWQAIFQIWGKEIWWHRRLKRRMMLLLSFHMYPFSALAFRPKKKKNQEIHNWALSCWSSLTSTDLTFIISCSYVLAKIPVTDILNFCHLQESSATAFHGWWLTLSGFIPEKRTVWIFCWQRVLLWLQGLLCCTSVGGSGWELNIRSLPLRL